MKFFKNGAMFGLDARIALAIFGALSVISGAALYSAIQQAHAERYRQFLVEVIKATEQYYLDNGKMIPDFTADRPHTMDIFENREGLSTWKGPYLSITIDILDSAGGTITESGIVPSGDSLWMTMFYAKSSTWVGNRDLCISGESDCREWLHIYADSADRVTYLSKMALKLDELVDDSDGALEGKIRYYDDSVADRFYVYYAGLPRKKQ